MGRCLFVTGALLLGPAASSDAQTAGNARTVTFEAPRPTALVPLYASLGVVQGLDFDSTLKALDTGRFREVNPLLRSGSPTLMLAVKAGTTASIILASERLRKRHPKLAVALLIGVNAAYATVVMHNYSSVRRLR
jgi:hypothetical protein